MDELTSSTVYKLNCPDRNVTQNDRHFKLRFVEHERSQRLFKTDSTLSNLHFSRNVLDYGNT